MSLWRLILQILIGFILWLTFSEMRSIPSSSMYPTLRVGDRIIIEKALHRGLVGEQDVLIKRIVAKAGDSVQVRDGLLYINGTAQYEDFIAKQPRYTSNLTFVPEGHVYVLGDNRDCSYDSHLWGTLPIRNILGRYVTCCYRPSIN